MKKTQLNEKIEDNIIDALKYNITFKRGMHQHRYHN